MMRATLRAMVVTTVVLTVGGLLAGCENAVTGDTIRTVDSDTAKIGLLMPDSVTAVHNSSTGMNGMMAANPGQRWVMRV